MDLSTFWFDITTTVWTRVVLYLVIATVAALIVTALVGLVFRVVARRRGWPEKAVSRLRWPFRWLLMVWATWPAVTAALTGSSIDGRSRTQLDQLYLIAVICLAGWFVATVVSLAIDLVLTRYRTDVADNRAARRIRTQALVLRRVAVAAIIVITLASVLFTFPAAQAAGASLLASAGVLSIVAGVAAQSTLGNVVAGIQLAFSGAIRVDDVVIANGEWGRIEEITLTYVVLHAWDDRRIVLPSTYFTTTPFENWTRTSSELMQSVDFDLDWRVDPQAMRDEMHRVLERTKLWDGRVAVLQVTDAVGGVIHLRILLTAVDAPTLFDLRCFVREELIRWLHESMPEGLPRTRVVVADHEETPAHRSPRTRDGERDDRELFGGSAEGARRSREFTGPGPVPTRPQPTRTQPTRPH